jgi:NADH:ubiquinone reductase (H+-translocating)
MRSKNAEVLYEDQKDTVMHSYQADLYVKMARQQRKGVQALSADQRDTEVSQMPDTPMAAKRRRRRRRIGAERVVIVGGGFAGLACARALDGAPVNVLLLEPRNYHLFTPLLYQVAAALLDPSDVAYPFRTIFRRSGNVRFRQAHVTRVDLDARRVYTAAGEDITYDTLVLATGSTNAYFGNPGLAEQTIGTKALDEAMRLRNHVLSCLERAAQAADPDERAQWLTFVIVGGGPTGVEYAGALAELLKRLLGRDFPEIPPGSARIVLVEGMDRLLDALHPRLGAYATDTLRKRGVEVRLSTLVRDARRLIHSP